MTFPVLGSVLNVVCGPCAFGSGLSLSKPRTSVGGGGGTGCDCVRAACQLLVELVLVLVAGKMGEFFCDPRYAGVVRYLVKCSLSALYDGCVVRDL